MLAQLGCSSMWTQLSFSFSFVWTKLSPFEMGATSCPQSHQGTTTRVLCLLLWILFCCCNI